MDKKILPVMYSVCSLFYWIFSLRIQRSLLANRYERRFVGETKLCPYYLLEI